jgi:hypothetical protein
MTKKYNYRNRNKMNGRDFDVYSLEWNPIVHDEEKGYRVNSEQFGKNNWMIISFSFSITK